jgi:eukaryotic-like serine/threonine-protein kinase
MALSLGSKLGSYEVLAALGAGGMGEVYRARDTRLGREVAIKVLPAERLADENRRRRFTQEARAASGLNHPNIVTIHEIESADGIDFIVMEYVPGKTLAQLIAAPMRIEDVLKLAIPIADAVASAHAAGIVHRDIKPGNIVVSDGGVAKLLDFGLAKLVDDSGSHLEGETDATAAVPLSRPGGVAGTHGYMSPEQATGGSVDARSDVFAFGAVLYEMVTGRRAFARSSTAETLAAVLTEVPKLPSELVKRVPRQLEKLIERCLAKDPARRSQHMSDVKVELEEIRDELGKSSANRARRAMPRAAYLGTGLALAAALLAGIGFIWLRGAPAWLSLGGPPIRSLAVLPLENLSADSEQEFFADGMTDALITELAKLGGLRVISRTSTMSYKKAHKPLPQVAQELGVDAVVEGSVLRSGERVRITAQLVRGATDEHVWAEEYERDIRDVLTLQREVARAIARQIQVKLTPQEQAHLAEAPRVDPEANELYLKGLYYYNEATGTLKPPEVRKLLEQSVDSLQAAIQRAPDYAASHAALARSYVLLANRVGTHALLDARAAARRALEIDPGEADAHVVTGFTALQLDWDWAGAERHYQRAIELSPNLAEAHGAYAELLSLLDRSDQAIAEIERAQQLDPLRLLIRVRAGGIYTGAGQYDRAIATYRALRVKDPQNFQMPWAMGTALVAKGSYEEGLAEYRSAVGPHGGHPNLFAAIATTYALSGRKDEARKILTDLREREDHGGALVRMAGAHVALGETDEAMACLERAYRERDPTVLYIPTAKFLKPLQSDPRYQDLVRRIGWPGAAKR